MYGRHISHHFDALLSQHFSNPVAFCVQVKHTAVESRGHPNVPPAFSYPQLAERLQSGRGDRTWPPELVHPPDERRCARLVGLRAHHLIDYVLRQLACQLLHVGRAVLELGRYPGVTCVVRVAFGRLCIAAGMLSRLRQLFRYDRKCGRSEHRSVVPNAATSASRGEVLLALN